MTCFWRNADRSEIQPSKDVPCTLKVIRKNNLNRFIFAHININSIRNESKWLVEQVKNNDDVLMILEIKQQSCL